MKITISILLTIFSFNLSAQQPFIVSYKQAKTSFYDEFKPLLSLVEEYGSYSKYIEREEYLDINKIQDVENENDLKNLYLHPGISTIHKTSSHEYSNLTKNVVKDIISMAENDSYSEAALITNQIKQLENENSQINAQSQALNDRHDKQYEADVADMDYVSDEIERLQSNLKNLAKNIQNQEKSVQWSQNNYNTCRQTSNDCTLQYNNLVSYQNMYQTMITNYNGIVEEESEKRNWLNGNVEKFNKANDLYIKKLNDIIELNNEKIKKNNSSIEELLNKKYLAYLKYYNTQKPIYVKKRNEEYDIAVKKMKELGGGPDVLYKIKQINKYVTDLFENLMYQKYSSMVQILDELEELGKANPNSQLGTRILSIKKIKAILDQFITDFDEQAPPFLLMQNFSLGIDAPTNEVLIEDRKYLISKYMSDGDNIVDVYESIYRQSKIEISGNDNIHFIIWFGNLPNLTYLSLESEMLYDPENFKSLINVNTLRIKAGNSARLEAMSKMPKLKKVIITANNEVSKKEIKEFCESTGLASEDCVIVN